jgi:Ni,Fe-hydrogenase III large subunit
MPATDDILRDAEAAICRPWLRHILSHTAWTALAGAAAERSWSLLAHWADTLQAHALFLDPDSLAVVPVSAQVKGGSYPALSPILPAAAWYERMIHDLWGHEPAGAADLRAWLDHGHWPLSPPMAVRPEPRPPAAPPAPAAYGQGDPMLLPLGPVWGLVDEAAHLSLTLDGPTIRRAESLLGFAHKGTLTLMRGKSPRAAARFAARLSADATVAHSVAFAHAAEAAMDIVAPPRAVGLRIVMMEIERAANHLDNLAEVARLAESGTLHTSCGRLREILLRASGAAFGHRLMMDCVIPGGVAADIADDGPRIILHALGDIASEMPAIRRLHDAPAMWSRLTGLARVARSGPAAPAGIPLPASLAAGGIVGRAAGYPFDARTVFTAGYRDLSLRIALRHDGDAAARQHLRMLEIDESLRLIGSTLEILPAGPLTVALPQVSGEGIGCAESVRGDVWHWLRLDHGQIAAAFPRDPGWALWPLAERLLEHAAAEDVDLVRASLALPASAMDL